MARHTVSYLKTALAVLAGVALWIAVAVAVAAALALLHRMKPDPDGELLLKIAFRYFWLLQLLCVVPIGAALRRRRCILAGLLSAAAMTVLMSVSFARPLRQLRPAEQAFVSDSFTVRHRWEDVPEPTRQAFLGLVSRREQETVRRHGAQVRIANDGEAWNEYDFGVDPALPFRRLVAAGESGQHAFLYYDSGVFGRYLLVFDRHDGQLRYAFSRTVWTRFRSIFMLKRVLEFESPYSGGELDTELRFL